MIKLINTISIIILTVSCQNDAKRYLDEADLNLNKGTYSVEIKPEETIVYSLVPQYETVERNTGREVARFELKWFSGNFKMGIGVNENNGNVNLKNVTATPAKAGGINRGEVYAAVKYNGRWKAARIYTTD